MREGAHVFEIHKCCKEEVRTEPDLPRRWTGWHADKMGLGLSYLQCQRVNESLTVEGLASVNAKDDPGADRWCRMSWFEVGREEMFQKINDVLEKQVIRVGQFRAHGGTVLTAVRLNVMVLLCLVACGLLRFVLRKLRP